MLYEICLRLLCIHKQSLNLMNQHGAASGDEGEKFAKCVMSCCRNRKCCENIVNVIGEFLTGSCKIPKSHRRVDIIKELYND